jgi:hypothetical protein
MTAPVRHGEEVSAGCDGGFELGSGGRARQAARQHAPSKAGAATPSPLR